MNARQPGQPTARALWSDNYHPGYFTLLLRRIICCPGCAESRRSRNTYIYRDAGCNGDPAGYGNPVSNFHTAAHYNRQPHTYPFSHTDCSAYRQTVTQPDCQPDSNPDTAAAHLYRDAAPSADCHLDRAAAHCYLDCAAAHCYLDDTTANEYRGTSLPDQYPCAYEHTYTDFNHPTGAEHWSASSSFFKLNTD